MGKKLMTQGRVRIGIDWGGTKIEALAMDADGRELRRLRIPTPRHDYEGSIRAAAELVASIERDVGLTGPIGAGIPGTIVPATGLVKNANSTWLNGRPLEKDLSFAFGREVRCVNDANCLAISESADGAAAGQDVVFAAILGTGCGGGGRSPRPATLWPERPRRRMGSQSAAVEASRRVSRRVLLLRPARLYRAMDLRAGT